MKVTDEDAHLSVHAGSGLHELTLRALSTIEEQ
jgi:hypothetical protein